MPDVQPRRSERAKRIREAADHEGRHTEHFARAGRCSLAEAVVELMRLEDAGAVERGRGYTGMTWRLVRP